MQSSLPVSLHLQGDVRVGLAVTVVLALVAWKLGAIKRGGLVAGLIVGTVVYAAFGWPGFVLLLLFFATSEASTRHTLAAMKKQSRAFAEDKKGAKTFGEIFVPGVVPLLAGLVMIFTNQPTNRFLSLLAFVAALTTSLGDLVSTDLGQVYGKRTYQLITLDRVRAGTRGGVSVEGSIYGAATILLFTVITYALFGLGEFNVQGSGMEFGVKAIVIVIFAAVLANHIESVISGILEQFQKHPNKQLLSFIGGVVGALLAVFFTNLPEG